MYKQESFTRYLLSLVGEATRREKILILGIYTLLPLLSGLLLWAVN